MVIGPRIAISCKICRRALYVEDGPACLDCTAPVSDEDPRLTYTKVRVVNARCTGTKLIELSLWQEARRKRKSVDNLVVVKLQVRDNATPALVSLSRRIAKAEKIEPLPKRRAFYLLEVL